MKKIFGLVVLLLVAILLIGCNQSININYGYKEIIVEEKVNIDKEVYIYGESEGVFYYLCEVKLKNVKANKLTVVFDKKVYEKLNNTNKTYEYLFIADTKEYNKTKSQLVIWNGEKDE